MGRIFRCLLAAALSVGVAGCQAAIGNASGHSSDATLPGRQSAQPTGTVPVEVVLDVPADRQVLAAGKRVQTIPASAAYFQITVKDDLGYIAGGIPYQAIRAGVAMTIPALPTGQNLRFLTSVTDAAGVEVAVSKNHETLQAGGTPRVVVPIFMDAPDLSAATFPIAIGQYSGNRVSVRAVLPDTEYYAFVPSVRATDQAGNPVTCLPTFVMVGGYEGPENIGETTTTTTIIVVRGNGTMYDAQARITENCGPTAKNIWREIAIQRVASASVSVN